MAYQPMIELLDYLRANGFKTFIVSGGGVEFIRAFAERSTASARAGRRQHRQAEVRDAADGPVLLKLPDVLFVDDGPGKPVGIGMFIGRRPSPRSATRTATSRCSSGRGRHGRALLSLRPPRRRRARMGLRPRLEDRAPRQRLDEAKKRGWTVTSMKDDWKTIYVGAASVGLRGCARGRSTKGEAPSSRGGTRMRTDPKTIGGSAAVTLASAVLAAACASTSGRREADGARRPARGVLTVQQILTWSSRGGRSRRSWARSRRPARSTS
jgi:hypothetical protein